MRSDRGGQLTPPYVECTPREAGIHDRTLLVVTADHGDELFDHRNIEHGRMLWNKVLHVLPLDAETIEHLRSLGYIQ